MKVSGIKDIEQLIASYLNGECSIEEQNKLLQWIEESDENQILFYRLKDVWDASNKKEDQTNQALLQFYKKQSTKNKHSIKTIQFWRFAAVAAVLIAGLISVVLLNSQRTTNNNWVTYKVPLGSRSEVILADGSHVVLNSGSEISYPEVFKSKQRIVKLTGEASFNVKSDKTNPFRVETSDFNVYVTGTEFNVCSYHDNNYSSLTLAQGKVEIQFTDTNEKINVPPGQQLKLNRENNKYHLEETDVIANMAWKNGEFRFKEIAFTELIKRLERWYNVTLLYSAPELEVMRYSGRFKNQETIWQVLDALKLTTPIDYLKQGDREFKIIYQPI